MCPFGVTVKHCVNAASQNLTEVVFPYALDLYSFESSWTSKPMDAEMRWPS